MRLEDDQRYSPRSVLEMESTSEEGTKDTHWLQRSERIENNPLQSVTKVQPQGRQVLQRRAFSEDEMKRLLGIAGSRRVVYLAAVFTGLRRGELKQLLWDDIHHDSPQPYLVARASTTKNHKQAAIVLHPDLSQELQVLKSRQGAKMSPDPYALAALLPTMRLFKEDLVKAKIEFVNARGQQC